MTKWFWLRRWLLAFVAAWIVLYAVHLLKGYGASDSAGFAALWGAIAATIFTLTGYIKYRRNPACMLPPSRES